ncbi:MULTISPECIES: helix-turn-helix domain-containing protein [Brevibacillus]|uniref:AraC family transcriptional regulator n=1 Tax=Brevibacillus parabrevis TaxID=54914 RepID=A0A4Y3PLT7_BREPA|nr:MULTISPECIES: helix-turn-helix domain-containing protein [Brevibacillus]RNB97425.1 helix-turn-helix domain-containing protein [Brevibacillus parabrevis]UED69111.1 helix-turn-helix domain-containing protein [Brevibacillus sp. HD3.3A]GEB34314.1 hypothetical protein BPA01_38940 [Brevibacillus parabrevis]
MRTTNLTNKGHEDTSSYLFKLIKVIQMDDASLSAALSREHHALLYVHQSRNGEETAQMHYAAPYTPFVWKPEAAAQPSSCYELQFACYSPKNNNYEPHLSPILPAHVPISPFAGITDLVKELVQLQGHAMAMQLEQMKANIKFQELLLELMAGSAEEKDGLTEQGIEYSRKYIEQFYASEITREHLAALAGLNPDYYSRAFKKKYGKTPIEYVNQVRIKHAKQSLLLSNESFRTIAHQVGYSDEFYFSRKFKLETGMSPTFYINKIKMTDKIASLKHLTTGHLVALNVQPYAAVKNNIYPIEDRLEDTINIGQSTPELEKLLEARPELIIMREHTHEDLSLKEQLYNQIAPTITLPYHQDWRIHLQSIAKAIGKASAANAWLEQYEEKAERIRRKYAQKIEGQTFLIVGIGAGEMCIYGKRNVGTVLYGDLQLAVPAGVEQIAHYQETNVQALKQYDPEHIILTSYRHDGSERMNYAINREVQQLFRQADWQELKAVRNSSVYPMYQRQHLYTCYTSLSHDLLLDQMDQLLESYISK